ncbi:unnamed protein product [Peniophora sp. CBMAI 1063]|nr:unnamed protein product [Peniophora sp. CBMAI 1063]
MAERASVRNTANRAPAPPPLLTFLAFLASLGGSGSIPDIPNAQIVQDAPAVMDTPPAPEIPLPSGPNAVAPDEAGINKPPPSNPMRSCCGSRKNGRRLVVCIDGTSNQYGDKNTNVIELYRLIRKGEGDNQLTYYNSGIGTYAQPSSKTWSYYKRTIGHKLDLAIAWNFERILLGAYHWLSENYRDGDCIFLFGFSRGAYQVRTLSAMIRKVGLIHRGNEAQIPFAYQLYADPESDLVHPPAKDIEDPEASIPRESSAATFKTTFSREVKVHFVGAWDTVSSIGVVRARKLLPETIDGMTHVCFFRHALALDERRVKFLPEYANGGAGPSKSQLEPVSDESQPHTKEVWFAGTHSDVGGGNEENKSLNRTRPSLRWMFSEASAAGLRFDHFIRNSEDIDDIKIGKESLTLVWRVFEHAPFRRLTYGERKGGGRWIDNRWGLVEILVLLVWKLVELLLNLLHFLWKLVTMDKRGLRAGWSVFRPLTSLAQPTSVDDQKAEGWRANKTTSWPHRGKGRVIQFGQRIHTSVWRSKNLSTVVAENPTGAPESNVMKTSMSATMSRSVLSRLTFWSQSQTMYTPSAYLPSEPEFWQKIRQPDTALIGTADEWKDWREVDLYDSIPDLFRQYIAHPAVDPNDDSQRTQLAMMSIHAKSVEGRDVLLRGLHGLLSDHARPIAVDILCSVLAILTRAGTRAKDSSPLELWPHIIHRLPAEATDDQRQTIRLFMENLADGPDNHLSYIFQQYVGYDSKIESDVTQHRQLDAIRFYASLADTRQMLFDELKKCLQLAPSNEDPTPAHIDSSILCSVLSAILERSSGRPDEMLGQYRTVRSQILRHIGDSASQEDLQIVQRFVGHFSDLVWRSLSNQTVPVCSVTFSPDGRHIASGSFDSMVRIWDLDDVETVTTCEGHSDVVWTVAFSPDGKSVASGSGDGKIRIWDVGTGGQSGEPFSGHAEWVRSVMFSSDGRHLLSGSNDNELRIWDVATGETVGEVFSGHEMRVYSAAFSPDDRWIVSSSRDYSVRIWDVETRRLIGSPRMGQLRDGGRPESNSVRSVAFSPDGKLIVSAYGITVRLWSVAVAAEGQDVAVESLASFNGHTGPVNCVGFSQDGQRIVSASDDHTIRMWDVATRRQLGRPFTGHAEGVSSVALSPDGRRIVSGSKDNTVRLWDVPEFPRPAPPRQRRQREESRALLAHAEDGSDLEA